MRDLMPWLVLGAVLAVLVLLVSVVLWVAGTLPILPVLLLGVVYAVGYARESRKERN